MAHLIMNEPTKPSPDNKMGNPENLQTTKHGFAANLSNIRGKKHNAKLYNPTKTNSIQQDRHRIPNGSTDHERTHKTLDRQHDGQS